MSTEYFLEGERNAALTRGCFGPSKSEHEERVRVEFLTPADRVRVIDAVRAGVPLRDITGYELNFEQTLELLDTPATFALFR